MGFDELFEDLITIEKQDGKLLGPVKGSVQVQRGRAHLLAQHPIKPGDVLIRKLPWEDSQELFVVIEPGYMNGMDEIPAMYEATIRREDVQAEQATQPSVFYNFYGANARFNQNSADHSVNITIDAADTVFDDLRAELRSKVNDEKLLAALSVLVDDMQQSRDDGPTMSQKLGQFISTGANVMGIIGPFIPVLTAMASGVGG